MAAFEKCSEQMKVLRGARAGPASPICSPGWFMFGCVILWEVYCYPVYTNKLQNRQPPGCWWWRCNLSQIHSLTEPMGPCVHTGCVTDEEIRSFPGFSWLLWEFISNTLTGPTSDGDSVSRDADRRIDWIIWRSHLAAETGNTKHISTRLTKL